MTLPFFSGFVTKITNVFMDRGSILFTNVTYIFTVAALPLLSWFPLARELHKILITENHKIVTFVIKDLYVNLPKQGIIQSTIFWLEINNINKKIKEQIIQLLNIIIEHNFFQYNNQFFIPENGIAMGSPITGTLAEIYLQVIEELYIKHWIESQEIFYFKRYVDDILIIFDQHRRNETITSVMNNINEQLDF